MRERLAYLGIGDLGGVVGQAFGRRAPYLMLGVAALAIGPVMHSLAAACLTALQAAAGHAGPGDVRIVVRAAGP